MRNTLWCFVGPLLVVAIAPLFARSAAVAPHPSAAPNRAQATAVRDAPFWRAIAANHYEVPAGASVRALAFELSAMLGSPDPELRDDIAYSTLTTWIYSERLVDVATLRELIDQWLGNLRADIGSRGNDAVLKRSFSALMLSVTIARDNADPFLSEAGFRRIFQAAMTYLGAEVDLRGYDEKQGWIHSAAHTADLLKFLGRSRYMTIGDQRTILGGIREKMQSAPLVFTHGEDERYARAVLSLITRPDFDRDGFRVWCDALATRPAENEKTTETTLAHLQNIKNLLAKLEVVLSTQPESTPATQAALEQLRTKLRTAF